MHKAHYIKKVLITLSGYFLLLIITALPASAVENISTSDWSSCLQNGDVATLACIPIVMQNIINFLLGFAAMVCVFIIIFAGFKFVTSEGDPEKITSARRTALYGIAGFLLIVGSFLVMGFIGEFTGVSQLQPK